MRKLTVSTLMVLIVGLLGAVAAQSFSGTFVATEGEMSVTIQQGQNGSLTGTITGPTGQYPLEGQANGSGAYGTASSVQGPLGFQAELGADGQTLQMTFYQTDANNQPIPVSPVIVLLRQGGIGSIAGVMPPQPPTVPGLTPPTFIPPQPPESAPLSMVPPATPNPLFGAQSDWNGTFVGNAGNTALVIQGGQGAYSGYIHDQGQQYQFQAHLDDATLHGELMAGGSPYEFWADRDGSTVYLYVGSDTYVLEPAGTPGAP